MLSVHAAGGASSGPSVRTSNRKEEVSGEPHIVTELGGNAGSHTGVVVTQAASAPHSCPGNCSRLAAMPGHPVRNEGLDRLGVTWSRMASEKTGVLHVRAHSSRFFPGYFQALGNLSPRQSVPETAAGEGEVLGMVQRGNQTWSGQCCPIR